MTDSFLYRSLPAFTGLLVFMPACGSNDPTATDTETDGSGSSGETSTSPSTTDVVTTGPQDTSSTETSPTEPTTDATEDSGPETCSADSLCADGVPEGWFGPLIMARNGMDVEPPECPEDFPTQGPDLLDGFVAPAPAECTCQCEAAGGPNCYASFILGNGMSCYGCYDYYNCYNQLSEACLNVDVDGFARFQLFGGGYYGGGNCTASQDEHLAPLDWEAQIKTCQLTDTPLSCTGGGICVPPPVAGFESRWCLYQQGDSGCPAGVFNTKHKFYMGADDTRECSDCVCGSVAADCYSADLMVFEGPDCAGEPVGTIAPNSGCQDIIAGSVAVDYGLQDGCPVANAPHAMGTAEPTGVFTFCCTE